MHQVQEKTAVIELLETGEINCHAAEMRERNAVKVARVRKDELEGCRAKVDGNGMDIRIGGCGERGRVVVYIG